MYMYKCICIFICISCTSFGIPIIINSGRCHWHLQQLYLQLHVTRTQLVIDSGRGRWHLQQHIYICTRVQQFTYRFRPRPLEFATTHVYIYIYTLYIYMHVCNNLHIDFGCGRWYLIVTIYIYAFIQVTDKSITLCI